MRRTEWTSLLPEPRIHKLSVSSVFIWLPKDVTTDLLRAAEAPHQKCRREYDLMMVMSPTWGFWQRRMARGEGAWAKRAQITPNGTLSGLLCCRICSFISRTSPALDPRDCTCWRDACATERLHPSPRCQPRSAWRSRYGQRVHARTNLRSLSFLLCCLPDSEVQRWMQKNILWATFAWDAFSFFNTCVCSPRMPFHDDLEFSAAEATQGFALLNCYLCNPCMALMMR